MYNHYTHHENIDKKSSSIKIKILLIVCLLLGFSAGLFIGAYYYRMNKNESGYNIVRIKGYKFTSPLVDYEINPELKNKEIFILKNAINNFINDKIHNDQAIYVSVYFRDMLNGPWFGINEKDNFSPASLLKVPLMIAYFKYAEKHPEILNHTLTYEGPTNDGVTQNILPDDELKSGQSYSIEELIFRMIAYSDNNAKDMLLFYIDKNALDEVYTDLGIIVPDIRNIEDFITTREYSSFFRILYNASYLNREMSEKSLEILSKSNFRIGLVAGVPKDILVAHKFAERGNLENKTLQLHDCGIVYYKERPYLLCIMTYGRNFETLVKIIKDISSIVYKGVDSYYKTYK